LGLARLSVLDMAFDFRMPGVDSTSKVLEAVA
jgi:hypothetical protein